MRTICREPSITVQFSSFRRFETKFCIRNELQTCSVLVDGDSADALDGPTTRTTPMRAAVDRTQAASDGSRDDLHPRRRPLLMHTPPSVGPTARRPIDDDRRRRQDDEMTGGSGR